MKTLIRYQDAMERLLSEQPEPDRRKTVNARVAEHVRREPHPLPATVWLAVERRLVKGERVYGTPLYPFNGRDARADCFQEIVDALAYCEQFLLQQELLGKQTTDKTDNWVSIQIALLTLAGDILEESCVSREQYAASTLREETDE